MNEHRYVGSSMDLARREGEHFDDLRRGAHFNRYLQRAYDAHGRESFVFEVLETQDDPRELLIREQYWIDTLKPEYNLLLIVDEPPLRRGSHMSAEVRAKITKSCRREDFRRVASERQHQRWQDSEYRRIITEHLREAQRQPGQREVHQKVLNQLRRDPGFRAKVSTANKVRGSNANFQAEQRARAKADWLDPEYQRKHWEGMAKVEAELSKTSRRLWTDPAFRARNLEGQRAAREKRLAKLA